jgi:hypothetical protein
MMLESAATAGLGSSTATTLKERGYPPSGQEAATQTVLQQAELMAQGGIAFATV